MKNNSFMDKLFSSKRFNMFLSLLFAVITWIVVSLYIDPARGATVTGVPVDFTFNAATYESQGLEILDQEQMYVTVDVEGDGIIVNNLKPEDFTVYPVYSQEVRGPGTYVLSLQIRSKKSNVTNNFEITKISPSSVTVKFDKVTDKKMPITVNPSMLEVEKGYYLDTPVAAPGEITLHGPETALNRVAKIVANVSVMGARKESTITTSKLELQDKDGNVISATENHITMDAEQVEVRLNILEERDVPLKAEFINAPSGFDTSILNMKLSQEVMRIAGPANLWDTLQEFVIGYVDLTTFDLNKELSFPIKLPDGFINRDNLITVTATFDTDAHNLTKKLINVDKISVTGTPPKGVELKTPDNARLKNVQLIGPEDVLEDITSDNVIAQINRSELSSVNGQQEMIVRILVPGYSNVFATGSYKIICETTAS